MTVQSIAQLLGRLSSLVEDKFELRPHGGSGGAEVGGCSDFTDVIKRCAEVGRKLGIEDLEKKKCRCGVFGCVFILGDGRIVKFTTVPSEGLFSLMAKKLRVDLGGVGRHLPIVHNAWKLADDCVKTGQPTFVVLREDLRNAAFDNIEWWNLFAGSQLHALATRQPNTEDFVRSAARIRQAASRDGTEHDLRRFDEAVALMEALARRGIYLCDMHSDNWGIRKHRKNEPGVLVARDLGCVLGEGFGPAPPKLGPK